MIITLKGKGLNPEHPVKAGITISNDEATGKAQVLLWWDPDHLPPLLEANRVEGVQFLMGMKELGGLADYFSVQDEVSRMLLRIWTGKIFEMEGKDQVGDSPPQVEEEPQIPVQIPVRGQG